MNRPKILKSTIRLCELQRKIRNNRAEKGVGTMTPKQKCSWRKNQRGKNKMTPKEKARWDWLEKALVGYQDITIPVVIDLVEEARTKWTNKIK